MMSIICVYNDKETLDNLLIKSLEKQSNQDFEIILLDNRENKFKSAAEALNNGADKAKGDYLVFIHQDVKLPSNWIASVKEIIGSLENIGALGVAGRTKYYEKILTKIEHNVPPEKFGWREFSKPTKVETLDECLFIVPKNLFDKLKFDEKCCDGWHFYGADYCLTAAKEGYGIYVVPLTLYHQSTGNIDDNFYNSLDKLLKKHESELIISTTTGDWFTFSKKINMNPKAVRRKLTEKILEDPNFERNTVSKESYFSLKCDYELLKNELKNTNKIKSHNRNIEKELKQLKSSRSWKITGPLRRLGSSIKKMK